MKKRNSLIELYRLLFALNVVKSHGFFPEGLDYFSPGRVSVEFFFILTGYLFVRTLTKLKDLSLKESIPKLLFSKIIPLIIPLVIAVICNIVYNIYTKDYFGGIWGYLWYVEAMVITLLAYLIIRKFVKTDRCFFIIVLCITIVATLMRFSGIFYSWGYVRSAAAISLGMLIAKIPSIKLKHQNLLWLVVLPFQILSFAIVCFHLGNVEWFGGFMGIELLLDTIIYPGLIYFTFQLSFSCKVIDYLGALSFGLYAFQCPADLIRVLGVTNRIILLLIIIGASLLEDLVKRIYRCYKKIHLHNGEIQKLNN